VINEELLLKAGYVKYPCPYDEGKKRTLYQRRVSSAGMNLYFINFYVWDFSGFTHPMGDNVVSVEAALYRKDGLTATNATSGDKDPETDFRVSLQLSDTSKINLVEKFYEEVYNMMNCCPDLHNND
jgi:hypothetical protein